MNVLKLAIMVLLLAASVATPVLLNRAAQAKLRTQYGTIDQQAEWLVELKAANSNLATRSQPVEASAGLSGERLSELLRLRHEAGVLRRQSNLLQQAREDNRNLRNRLASLDASGHGDSSDPAAPPVNLPRDSWGYAGYATPEAVLQTFMWGMSRGDNKSILASMTGTAASEFAERLARDESNRGEFSPATAESTSRFSAMQIVKREALAADEVLLQVAPIAGNTTNKYVILRMRKLGNDWKITEKY